MTDSIVAPVCPISRSQPVSGQPGLSLPAIPRAYDLSSAIAALNQINMLTPQLLGRAVVNNVYPSQPFGQPLLAGNSTSAQDGGSGRGRPKKIQWEEISRETRTVRVASTDDDNIWVELDIIVEVVFQDRASGNYLIWRQHAGD